ncbi:MAG: hypothetical protein JO107_12150, partial [Hyphomicrobiales bacterium]|nr:hypothetical protein [Hyphomicrobiales bacterium]
MRDRVEITPATRADIAEAMRVFSGEEGELPARVLAFAGRLDGRLLGVGGVLFRPDGHRVAFCDVGDEGRRHVMTFHRTAIRVIKAAKAAGVRRLIAVAAHERSPHWLTRLG